MSQPLPTLWPLFDACAKIPLALIRGANSDVLSRKTADEMLRRRPDMLFAEVPDRGHIPFLDEMESVSCIEKWLNAVAVRMHTHAVSLSTNAFRYRVE
jgi:pimeloyl-ACP methyl ester carboxylesterase